MLCFDISVLHWYIYMWFDIYNVSIRGDEIKMFVQSIYRVHLQFPKRKKSWWRHQMEHFSALLALCAGIHRWIPLTKASDAERWCFLWSASWISGWVNNREAGDLRHHRNHYDVIAMAYFYFGHKLWRNIYHIPHCWLCFFPNIVVAFKVAFYTVNRRYRKIMISTAFCLNVPGYDYQASDKNLKLS